MTREQQIERALVGLYNACTESHKLSEEDEQTEAYKARRHQQIDFTFAHLRKIGRALRQAREALGIPENG